MDDPDLNPVDIDPGRIRAAIARWRARIQQIDSERAVLSRRLAVYEQLLDLSVEHGPLIEQAITPEDAVSMGRAAARELASGTRVTLAQAAARVISERSPDAGLTTGELLYMLPLHGVRLGGLNPRATLLTALKRSDLVYENPVERGRWHATRLALEDPEERLP